MASVVEWQWDGRDDAAAVRVDLLNQVAGNLIEVAAVKGAAGMRGDVEGEEGLPGVRVEGAQFVVDGDPDVAAVPCHSVHMLDAGKRSIFANYLSFCRCHNLSLYSPGRVPGSNNVVAKPIMGDAVHRQARPRPMD